MSASAVCSSICRGGSRRVKRARKLGPVAGRGLKGYRPRARSHVHYWQILSMLIQQEETQAIGSAASGSRAGLVTRTAPGTMPMCYGIWPTSARRPSVNAARILTPYRRLGSTLRGQFSGGVDTQDGSRELKLKRGRLTSILEDRSGDDRSDSSARVRPQRS